MTKNIEMETYLSSRRSVELHCGQVQGLLVQRIVFAKLDLVWHLDNIWPTFY